MTQRYHLLAEAPNVTERLLGGRMTFSRPNTKAFTWRRLLLLISVTLTCTAWLILPLDRTSGDISEQCIHPPHVWDDRPESDIRHLSALWDSLTDLFASQAPHPERIIRPILSRPHHHHIWSFTPELADTSFSMDSAKAEATREAHGTVVDSLPAYNGSNYRGQGLVMLAGGRYSTYAAITLSVLRQLGSKLPVEVWIKDETEDDESWASEIHRQGAVLRRLSDYAPVSSVFSWANPSAWWTKSVPWSPYQMKSMAIIFSSFEQVLYLDADCAPLQDPQTLFTSMEYLQHGAVLWPDFWPSIASRWLPYLIGLSDEPSEILWHQQTGESGQMLIHKERHWKSLLLAAYYNYHGPSFWYTAITGSGPGWGDKDTYLIALQALREPFEMIPEGPHSLEASNTSEDVLTVQFSPNVPSAERLPFFVHSCGGIKWGLDEFIYAFSAARIVVWAKSLFNHRYRLLHDLLHSGHRILRREARWPDLDPEYILWMALEDTACARDATSCAWTRERIHSIFGILNFREDPGC